MVQPTETFDTYDAVGIREDLSDVIHNISPSDTPFYSMCKKINIKNQLYEWQTDALRASADNKHIVGDDTTAQAVTATTRLNNRAQIFKDAVTVADSNEAYDAAGRGKELAYQSLKVAKAQKLDIERALFLNNAKVTGSSSVAPELAGVPAWLATNTVFESGNTGADPTGDGSNARTDDGTPVAFSQARFDSAMQAIWESGGKPEKVFLSSFQMNVALGFDGNNNQRSTIGAGDRKVINNLKVYVTPWGDVEFIMSREHRSRDVFIMQPDMWKIGMYRGTKNVALAKTGDNTKRQISTELTLISCNEAASGAVYDNTTS